ncbi:MAG: transglutaminase-like domain-containing protein [Bacteroidales bacterium]|nr:transglutaminase-like domain-containing protein [Bacteroidales bacterium]
MNKKSILALALCAIGTTGMAQTWKTEVSKAIDRGEFARAESMLDELPKSDKAVYEVQIDSLRKTMSRIRRDFSITPAAGRARIEKKLGKMAVSDYDIARWKLNKYIEYKVIDGQEWWFRRGINNFSLLNRKLFAVANEKDRHEGYMASTAVHYNDAMKTKADKNGTRDWRLANITMTIDVDADVVPAGETLRVWMPIPYENLRQKNVKLLKSSHPATLSEGSIHHTAYMEAKAVAGQKTHFEINYSYEVGERHIDQATLLKRVKPYDKQSDVYKRYTASEYPHQVVTPQMQILAKTIVGTETNPVLQASKIYDWIAGNFEWAGAREYSTIPNIPEYVLEIQHGDCGQVSLLYITLCRSIGIPARWESGWMLHPGEVNLHDWAETYFEGVGWVPTDQSFGRSTRTEPLADYYKTGLDVYRMAANEGVGGEFSPKKKYIRCETVDSQAGEVEWRGGNLEYGTWHYDLNVNSMTPIK